MEDYISVFIELHHGTCFGKEFRYTLLHSLEIGDIISTSVPNNPIVNWSVTILTHSTLTKSPKWPISIRSGEVTILYFHFGVVEKSWRQLYQSFYNLSLPNWKPYISSSYGFTCFLFKNKRRTYCYCFFPRRFFLSSIEAAVEHIRGGYVNDVLKGLSPAKVCIVFVWKIGSLCVSGNLLTYPFPKPTFFPKWEVNDGLGEG